MGEGKTRGKRRRRTRGKKKECTDRAEAVGVQVCVINTRYLLNFLFDVCFNSWFLLWGGLRGNPKGLAPKGQVRCISRNEKPVGNL